MLIQELAMDILAMKRSGLSARHISRVLGIDRRTVRRYGSDPSVIGHRKTAIRPGKIDPYKAQIEHWLDEDEGYSARWIYNKLVAFGFTGAYERVKLFVRSQKQERSRVAYIRFETEPAQHR